MILKRVLHHVGQGGFFTEHFYYNEEKNVRLNVVYDCGSKTYLQEGISALVESGIRSAFNFKEHIDLLVISHFDEDHTNGLKTLLDYALLDKRTHVVIPFKYPYLLMVMEKDYPSMARFVMEALNRGIHLIGVDGSLQEVGSFEPIDIDRLDGFSTLSGREVVTFKKDGKPIWYYYPFMMPGIESLQSIFEDKVENNEDLKGVNLNDPEAVIDNLSKLRSIYQGIGHKKNGVTKINVNSLLMVSLPAKYVILAAGFDYNGAKKVCEAACLYPGDSVLKGKEYGKVVPRVEKVLTWLSDSKLGLMQIPHHGSKYCYPKQISDKANTFAQYAFVNYAPGFKPPVFDKTIQKDFQNNGKELIEVTDDSSTKVEFTAILK